MRSNVRHRVDSWGRLLPTPTHRRSRLTPTKRCRPTNPAGRGAKNLGRATLRPGPRAAHHRMSNRPARCVAVRAADPRMVRSGTGTPGATGPAVPGGRKGALGAVCGAVIIQVRVAPPIFHMPGGRPPKERPPMRVRVPSALRLVAVVLSGSLLAPRPAPAQHAE